jgi:flagellar hook assembly protein FlgD
MLFVLLTSFIYSQTLVRLKLPNNCNANTVVTQENRVLVDKGSKIELFPNPSSGNFTLVISFKNNIDKATITVYDTKGKRVYTEIIFSNSNKLVKQFHIGGLLAGTYVFEVKTVKDISSTKLVINK